MSGHQTTTQSIKAARKRHRCDWCYERIEVGDEYRRYRSFCSNDAVTVKMHPECIIAAEAEAAGEGGCFEWTPGDYERPAKEQSK